ncbi:hypothetical protein QAD02_001055 [Eretmocerus hayati]|uniref:Uncharacterized protein n=1 Tax=Eretmocerus hayati TaxID=131215 RepID=A0ACC2NFX1_9HYME|nr:hypothetical protein QAD02_001055 [Eretmocerus hayati]
MHYFTWLWFLFGASSPESTATLPTVKTPLGTYFGHYKVSISGRKYAAFEGIPYAQPPVGPLRFEDPIPITDQFGQLNVTKKGSVCAQYHEMMFQGKEDCLYLNVHVPFLADHEKLMPVLVYIHGGSFQYGSSHSLLDKYFADRDVIFISINYRIGLLGFLSTEDEVVPGNMGLKDQSLALEWISHSIQYFKEYASQDNLLKQLDENWSLIAPGLLEYNYTIPSSMYDEVATDSRREYFGNESITKANIFRLHNLLKDRLYFVGIENGVRLQAAASSNPVYMYYYSFQGSMILNNLFSQTRSRSGGCHTGDEKLITEDTKNPPTETYKEREMINFFMDMEPLSDLDWEPVDATDPKLKYLLINTPGNYSMSGSRDFGRKSYWQKFFFTV